MKKLISTALLLTIISYVSLSGQVQLSDSAKISLMTVSPWTGAIYSLYGHTVLKVEDDSTGVDACFNYGYFDSSQPDFMYHFIRGETDYVLGVTSYQDFLTENQMKGLEVVEQELNLSLKQKQQLWEDLYINSLPENCRYRYNYFFDNCATRPRDMVEKVLGKPIIYTATNKNQTFRDLIHECVSEFVWMEFGIDLVIGSDADKVISDREKMFLPYYLMNAFEGAKIVYDDTNKPPLVKTTTKVLEADNKDTTLNEWSLLDPLSIAFVLLIVSLLISFSQLRFDHSKTALIYDTMLFLVAGLAGLVVTFLVFFSEHPATSPNWNLAWLHIFHLIFAFLFWVKSFKKLVYYYHFINFAVLSLFLLSWWFLPQQMPLATIPFALSLWLRSSTNFLIIRNDFLKNKQYKTAKYMQAGWSH
ncbi:MAG: DUF4105 domain-containing protein [Dysgonamonadaceae bacterium]|nr:DUF4105 domain-containing protein [Dysgonamonadaceae bacterium]MDD4729495.1 DUF4105 domain-containing protein [Dysgonamonadaceae bacterium]